LLNSQIELMKNIEFREMYIAEIKDFRIKFSQTGAFISAILILLGSFLDYTFYPDRFYHYFFVRSFAAFLSLIVFYVLKYKKSNDYIAGLTLFWLIIPQAMISYMIYDNDGFSSHYVFGLSLALFASSIIVPTNSTEGVFFGLATLLLYCMACIINSQKALVTMLFYGNLTFLLFGIIVSNVCTYFNENSRFDFFKLQKEVAVKNTQLQASNQELAEIKGVVIEQEKMSALGTLSAGLLHEVNNPVNYSLMAINMSLSDPDVKPVGLLRESLVDAKEGMMRVQAIVSDLKIFAYQKPGPNDHRVFLFENVISSARRLTSFETKGVDIQVDLPQDTHVRGDEPALIGVMINLITNATMAVIKAKQAQPVIRIKAWHEGGRLHVSTRDNGSGIEPQNTSKVFEPFFTTRDVGKGLGLGLAVCYGVIQRHDSVLKVASQWGEWTEFSFDLATLATELSASMGEEGVV
jgi:two-component system, sensor histidine kinase PhcS